MPSDCAQRADGSRRRRGGRGGREDAHASYARRDDAVASRRIAGDGAEGGAEEAEHEQRDAERPGGLEGGDGRLAEQGEDQVAAPRP